MGNEGRSGGPQGSKSTRSSEEPSGANPHEQPGAVVGARSTHGLSRRLVAEPAGATVTTVMNMTAAFEDAHAAADKVDAVPELEETFACRMTLGVLAVTKMALGVTPRHG